MQLCGGFGHVQAHHTINLLGAGVTVFLMGYATQLRIPLPGSS